MAWSTPATVTQDQLMTAAFWNEQAKENQTVLRAGGIALASQGAGDLLFASSATQLGRVAAANGTPYYSGGTWAFTDIRGLLYPIGSIYVAVVSTNPNTLLGVGTWSVIGTGRVLVGLDATQTEFDTVEETGGALTVTLSTGELPVHAHGLNDPGHFHLVGNDEVGGQGGGGSRPNPRSYPSTSSDQTNTVTTGITLQNAGSGGAHSNLGPSQVAYIWKRVS